jgi:hypothetical protein
MASTESRRPGTLALDRRRCQQAVEQRLSVLGDLTEPVLKDRLDVDALFAASMRAMRVRTCSSSWVDALSGAERYPLSPKAHGSTI